MYSLYEKLHNLHFKYNVLVVCYFVLFLLLGHSLEGFYGNYPIRNFTSAEYQAGIQNIDFAQNRDMTLFVANNLGVLSFNGDKWERYDFRTGKKKRSLAFDQQRNRLYVGLQGEFGYFSEDWQYVSLIDLIPESQMGFDEVWDVFLINDDVYFCTFQGIFVYDGVTIEVIDHEKGLERSFLLNGKLFTQSQDGQLFRVEQLKLIPIYPNDKNEEIIAGLIPYEDGYLLIYNSGQIVFKNALIHEAKYPDLIQALKGTYVNHVLQLSDTRLAIATQTAGLFFYDLQSGNIENITTEDGLATNACLRSFQDYYGNLWVGMQNGIALIRINSPMRLLGQEINLQGSGYEAYETDYGTYFTTSSGIYFLARQAPECIFIQGTEGPAYGIQEIAGQLYAGHHTGLFLLNRDKAKRIANIDGVWQVKQLRSRPEYAVAGTYFGLYLFRVSNNQNLEPVGKIDGFGLSSRFFEEDQQGNIWVGQYYKGLYLLSLSEDMREVEANKIATDEGVSIDEQILLSKVDGRLYLATSSGLYELNAENRTVSRAELFSKEIGEQPIYLFEQDRKNNIHLLTENGVGYFKKISNDNYQYLSSSLYQLRYHLNNDLLHVSVYNKKGVLFAANEGFVQYFPELENPLKGGQPLIIRQVFSATENKILYKQKPFEQRGESVAVIEVGPAARVLKIDVESFQFNDFNNTRFRYFLKGFDETFGAWTNATTKEYTNLKEGNYEFIVQTRNYLGEITTSQVLQFKVQPPFYRSMPAKILYVLAGIMALFLVSRLQKQRYKQKARKIEENRLFEKAMEQQKLARIEQEKEKELLRLKEEKIQSELQHVNKLLAASTMNLVVKNEFIESIKKDLQEVKKSGKQRSETKRALEKIVKGIDITLKLQEDWEQFEYHFEKVHSDFLSRLQTQYPNLSPNEQKLCTLLRLNLNTKEIANLLSISLRGVEVARYRLRKKLELEKGENLSKFILEY